MDDFDDASQFKDIPDSFVDVPPLSYPLVITFHKFLIMLDGTVGNSYFERFHILSLSLVYIDENPGPLIVEHSPHD